VVIEKDGDGFSMHFGASHPRRRNTGIDDATFQSDATNSKVGCPVFKLMSVEIDFEATIAS
jgi:hypothetical protein